MKIASIRDRLAEKGLRVTPQRIAILEAILELKNHPAAEDIIDFVRKRNPNISTATVYKVLDVLVANDIIERVKTDRDYMRYDAVMARHHHLYSRHTHRIEDYSDDKLNRMILDYFEKKEITGFSVEDVRLQILGTFTND